MPIISHKFKDHIINSKTELLILGTFNPNFESRPDFFYGRSRDFLWQLLPVCFGQPSLKMATKVQKMNFMDSHKINFIDVISSVDVPLEQENNVADIYIDNKVSEWSSVKKIIDSLPNLKAVYFTRKTFGASIPNITKAVIEIRNHVMAQEIYFGCLTTPARFPGESKQNDWINKIINREPCNAFSKLYQ